MRDYKGSGSFTLRERKRRRFPRGLVVIGLLLIAAAVAGYVYTSHSPSAGSATEHSVESPAKASSGRDIIPLKIPGQAPQPNSQQ